jgi:hypothetical protein
MAYRISPCLNASIVAYVFNLTARKPCADSVKFVSVEKILHRDSQVFSGQNRRNDAAIRLHSSDFHQSGHATPNVR